MSIWGALAGGFAGTLVLTTILRAASELRLTRIDLPFLLGTAFTANRPRAKALGYALHFIAGTRHRMHVPHGCDLGCPARRHCERIAGARTASVEAAVARGGTAASGGGGGHCHAAHCWRD